MPSSCSNYKTMNVKEVTFDSAISFTETKDHAKWAASPNSAHRSLLSNAYVTCIGDINRMTSQRKRGGGAVSTFRNFYFRMWVLSFLFRRASLMPASTLHLTTWLPR